MKLRKDSCFKRYFAVALILCLFLAGPHAYFCLFSNNVSAADVGSCKTAVQSVSLGSVTDAMSDGNFEIARERLSKTGIAAKQNGSYLAVSGLLDSYDDLAAELLKVRKETFRKYLDKVNENVEQARWRQSVLTASEAYNFDLAKKSELEKELHEQFQNNWLSALAKLASVQNLADKMDMTVTVKQSLRDEIITRCMKIAEDLEQQDKGLDAYGKVYYFLEVLDKKKYQYDEIHDRLQREVVLKSMYVPDPNTNGVSWQDRRKGINTEIIGEALQVLDYHYVEKPDYKKMALKGLEYCLIPAQIDGLKKTFESLNNKTLVYSYKRLVAELTKSVTKEVNQEDFTLKHLVWVIEKMLEINGQLLKFPVEVLLAEFVEGAFSATDSYTYVIWPAAVEEFNKSMTNTFSGIGVVILKDKEGQLKADSLVSLDTPAYRAGMDANDTILSIDGTDTETITLEKAVQIITGPAGTDVVLKINRENFQEPRDITVTRQDVVVPTVKGLYRGLDGSWEYMLDPNSGVAYLRLTHFSGETVFSFKQKLRDLKSKGMRALVLDLRNNSGGYLSAAVSIADVFIKEGAGIVSSRYRGGQKAEAYTATSDGTVDAELPVVVLINSISASASEIVSGALQDNGRAVVIGTRSFGKGSVQTIQSVGQAKENLPASMMKMTIAHYYLPSGRCVNRDPTDKLNEDYGVEPDVKVELTGEQFSQFMKVQRAAGILHHDNLPDVKKDWKIYTTDEILDSDFQLQMALLCLKANLLNTSFAGI